MRKLQQQMILKVLQRKQKKNLQNLNNMNYFSIQEMGLLYAIQKTKKYGQMKAVKMIILMKIIMMKKIVKQIEILILEIVNLIIL